MSERIHGHLQRKLPEHPGPCKSGLIQSVRTAPSSLRQRWELDVGKRLPGHRTLGFADVRHATKLGHLPREFIPLSETWTASIQHPSYNNHPATLSGRAYHPSYSIHPAPLCGTAYCPRPRYLTGRTCPTAIRATSSYQMCLACMDPPPNRPQSQIVGMSLQSQILTMCKPREHK